MKKEIKKAIDVNELGHELVDKATDAFVLGVVLKGVASLDTKHIPGILMNIVGEGLVTAAVTTSSIGFMLKLVGICINKINKEADI